jgi:hypothetical protein
MILNQLRYK